jgi:hypothetical protein
MKIFAKHCVKCGTLNIDSENELLVIDKNYTFNKTSTLMMATGVSAERLENQQH